MLPGNSKKKRIISQDDDSLSRFAPSDVEDDLQQEQQRRLSQRDFFVVNDTELWSEGQIENILSMLTEEFNNDKLCDPKINSELPKAINEDCGKKLTSEKLKVRLNKNLKLQNCDQLSPNLVNMEIFSNIPAHTRSQDVILQKMQKFLLKSAYPIVKILESILTRNNSNNIISLITCS